MTSSASSSSPIASASSPTSTPSHGFPSSPNAPFANPPHSVLPGKPCNTADNYPCAFDGRCSGSDFICGGFATRWSNIAQCAENTCIDGQCAGPLTKGTVALGEPCSVAQEGQCVDGATCYSSNYTEIPKCIRPTIQLGSIPVGEPCNPSETNPCAYGAFCSGRARICGATGAPCTLDSQCATNTCEKSAGNCQGTIVNGVIALG